MLNIVLILFDETENVFSFALKCKQKFSYMIMVQKSISSEQKALSLFIVFWKHF